MDLFHEVNYERRQSRMTWEGHRNWWVGRDREVSKHFPNEALEKKKKGKYDVKSPRILIR
jgi:hypothetical protein